MTRVKTVRDPKKASRPHPIRPRKYWDYLLVDLDGTLLDSRGTVSPRTRGALIRAVAGGMQLVVATGRTYRSLLRVIEGLDLPPFHMITNGGAVGLSPRGAEVRYTNFLAPELWPRVVETLHGEGLSTLVFSHRHPEPPLYYVSRGEGDPHFEAYLGRNPQYMRVRPRLGQASISNVVEVAALGRENGFDAASTRVLRRLAGITRNHSMVLYIDGAYGKVTEFFDPGTSKWRAFQALFPEAAAHPERVIAIGDEANDVEMIASAGLGIAMGNAVPAVKAVADRITGDNDQEGVADALEEVLRG